MCSINRREFLQGAAVLAIMPLFSACEKEIINGPRKIHWDRDMCERCKMVISDRNQSAQVTNLENGRTYKFDDIGCAIEWFKEENITWKDKAEIWITDLDTGKWIDARKAFYDTMNVTPMAYGFAAHETKDAIKPGLEIIDFEEMSKRILAKGHQQHNH